VYFHSHEDCQFMAIPAKLSRQCHGVGRFGQPERVTRIVRLAVGVLEEQACHPDRSVHTGSGTVTSAPRGTRTAATLSWIEEFELAVAAVHGDVSDSRREML